MKRTLINMLESSEIHFHAVTSRVKEPDSLRKKLRRKRKKYRNIQSVTDINDLVGLRVSFYTEADATKFVRLLHDQFKIHETDVHQEERGYNGINVTLSYDDGRLALPEYARHKNRQCEVQATTVLYHAWNEINHDTVYKPTLNTSRFPDKAEFIEKQMKDVAESLVGLQGKLDFIRKLSSQLSGVEDIYSGKYLDELSKVDDIVQLHDGLKTLHEVLSQFEYRFDKGVSPEPFLQKVYKDIPSRKGKRIKTIVGTYSVTQKDILKDVISLLRLGSIRYAAQEAALTVGFKHYSSKDRIIRDEAKGLLEDYVKYDMDVLNAVGYTPQLRALNHIKNLSDKELKKNLPAVLSIISHVANPSFEYHRMPEYDKVTWGKNALRGERNHRALRNGAFSIIKRLILLKGVDTESVLNASQEFSRFPHEGAPGKELVGAIRKDTENLFRFCLQNADSFSLHDLKNLDEYLSLLDSRLSNGTNVKKFKKYLEEHASYQFFRMLVGYDIRRGKEWQEVRAEREAFIEDVAQKVVVSEGRGWKGKLLEVARTHTPDRADQYEYFGKLLESIAAKSPPVAIKLYEEAESRLRPFFLGVMHGVEASNWSKSKQRKFRTQYSKNPDYLWHFAKFYRVTKNPVSAQDLSRLYSLARKQDEDWLSARILGTVVLRYSGKKSERELFVRIINDLTKKEFSTWTREVYFQKSKILDDLPVSEFKKILENLIHAQHLNHEVEEILEPLVRKSPKRIIDFLVSRIKHSMKFKRDLYGVRYDAIPYQFTRLNENGRLITPAVFKQLSLYLGKVGKREEYRLGSIYGVLLGEISPEQVKDISKYLRTANKDAVQNISLHLGSINEDTKLEVIRNLLLNPNGKEFVSSFSAALGATGMVSGTYGIANAYEQTNKKLNPWLKDKNSAVKEFAQNQKTLFKKRIEMERRRAKRDDDNMKMSFNS